jgi:hypothetical protein
MTALRPPEEGNNKMSKTLSGRIFKGGATAALAIAVSLAAAGSGVAATRHAVRAQNAPAYRDSPTYYDYAPMMGPSGFAAGGPGQRTNPTIVPPGAFGPPDPASCGGFHC